jgi:hypothetical protein
MIDPGMGRVFEMPQFCQILNDGLLAQVHSTSPIQPKSKHDATFECLPGLQKELPRAEPPLFQFDANLPSMISSVDSSDKHKICSIKSSPIMTWERKAIEKALVNQLET